MFKGKHYKAKCRKPRPSMPHWVWLGADGCWFCKNRNNCNNCGMTRDYGKQQIKKARDLRQIDRYKEWKRDND